jgi:hypothetical protein
VRPRRRTGVQIIPTSNVRVSLYFNYRLQIISDCLDEKRSQCVAKSPCSLKRKQDFESNENDNRAKLPSINHYRTQSGDYVDSLAKLCVANWLTAKNIPFSVDCSALKLLPIQPTFYLPEARLFIKLSSDNEVCINGKHDCLVITDNELRDLDKSLNRAAVLQSEQIKLLTN